MPINSIYNKDSRYVQGGTTTVEVDKLAWWERILFVEDTSDIIFTLTAQYNRRPDILAKTLYGKATLMWVILQLNNINDINEEFIEGKELRLPTRERIQLEILHRTSKDAVFK